MSVLIPALLIGVVCGLRAMTGPAVVSWAARLGWLPLQATPLAFLGFAWTPWIFSLLAAAELVTDQLPSTPSRKVPVQFATRLMTGAFCGAAMAAPSGSWAMGIVAGAVGAVVGTLGGAAARSGLVRAIGGNDHPIAILEDVIAIGGALLIVTRL